MNYCPNCGNKLEPNADVCLKCGKLLNKKEPTNIMDNGNIGWGVLGYFIPIVGLIIYIIYKDTKPITAKYAGIGALISVIINVVFFLLLFGLFMTEV